MSDRHGEGNAVDHLARVSIHLVCVMCTSPPPDPGGLSPPVPHDVIRVGSSRLIPPFPSSLTSS